MRGCKILKTIILSICTCSLFVSCTENNVDVVNASKKNNSEKIELNLWSHHGDLEEVIESFEKQNPNIKVNLKVLSYEQYVKEYKKSMVLKEGEADLFIIDSNDYGDFNSIKALEDLSKSDYTAMKYEADFDKDLWELGKSLDKTKLLGIPIASAPLVTYYRKDILEKYGFPGEPEELAEFMKNEDNWFDMATKLRQDNIFLLQWYAELVNISSTHMPYFNEKLEYQRANNEFKEAIDKAVRAYKLNLGLHSDIWTEAGQDALKEDRLAMLFSGSWATNTIKNLVPEQEGKWRVTYLPFGKYGWNNASIISMAENSTKKEAAWKFIEYMSFEHIDEERVGNVPGYLPLREKATTTKTSDFLGGQNEQEIYKTSLEKTKEYVVTPLDKKTFKLWDTEVAKGLEEGLSANDIMQNIANKIAREFSDIENLLNSKDEEKDEKEKEK